jgi:hypothetical protein
VITTAPKVASDSRPVDRPQARDQVNTLDRDPTNLVVPEENRKRRDHPAQNPAPPSGAALPG